LESQSAYTLERLCEALDGSDRADELGERMRSSQLGLELLVGVLGSTSDDLVHLALYLIGNLASDVVDSKAALTKEVLHELGAFDRVLPLIFRDSTTTIYFALGAIQNMCVRPEYAHTMAAVGAEHRIRELAQLSSTDTSALARGCLNNYEVMAKRAARGEAAAAAASRGGQAGAAETAEAPCAAASAATRNAPTGAEPTGGAGKLRRGPLAMVEVSGAAASGSGSGVESPGVVSHLAIQLDGINPHLDAASTASPGALRKDRSSLRAAAREGSSPYGLRHKDSPSLRRKEGFSSFPSARH